MFSLPSPSRCWLPNNSNKGKTAVDRYNPVFLGVLSVSCSCLAKANYREVRVANFSVSTWYIFAD